MAPADRSLDHAEVRERLETAFLSPGKLRSLASGEAGADPLLRDHLAACAACRAELAALEQTAAVLAVAAPDDLRVPAGSRERLLERVHSTGVDRSRRGTPEMVPARTVPDRGGAAMPGPSRLRWWWPLASATVIVVAVVGLFLGLQVLDERNRLVRENERIARVTATAERLLRDPATQRVTLRTPGGEEAGTVLLHAAEDTLVVVAESLPEGDGRRYHCYLVRDDQQFQIGPMSEGAGLAYWAGPVPDPADAGRPGDRFVVALDEGETPVLAGEF